MHATLDHPHVRASQQCPLCAGVKSTGLIACWPCYRSHELKYGNALAEEAIGIADQKLAQPFALTTQTATTDEHQPSLFN